MNLEITLWLLSGVFICVAGGTGAYFMLLNRISDGNEKLRLEISLAVMRVVKLETMFEFLGSKAAALLHSPHTPEFDAMLEKMVANKAGMTKEDWGRLMVMTEEVEKDENRPKEERSLAGMVSVICHLELAIKPISFQRHV